MRFTQQNRIINSTEFKNNYHKNNPKFAQQERKLFQRPQNYYQQEMGFTEFKIKVFPVPLNEETVPAIEVSGECPERLQAEENTSKNMSTLRRKMQQYSRIK